MLKILLTCCCRLVPLLLLLIFSLPLLLLIFLLLLLLSLPSLQSLSQEVLLNRMRASMGIRVDAATTLNFLFVGNPGCG